MYNPINYIFIIFPIKHMLSMRKRNVGRMKRGQSGVTLAHTKHISVDSY